MFFKRDKKEKIIDTLEQKKKALQALTTESIDEMYAIQSSVDTLNAINKTIEGNILEIESLQNNLSLVTKELNSRKEENDAVTAVIQNLLK